MRQAWLLIFEIDVEINDSAGTNSLMRVLLEMSILSMVKTTSHYLPVKKLQIRSFFMVCIL